jgi:hypothetical protein
MSTRRTVASTSKIRGHPKSIIQNFTNLKCPTALPSLLFYSAHNNYKAHPSSATERIGESEAKFSYRTVAENSTYSHVDVLHWLCTVHEGTGSIDVLSLLISGTKGNRITRQCKSRDKEKKSQSKKNKQTRKACKK